MRRLPKEEKMSRRMDIDDKVRLSHSLAQSCCAKFANHTITCTFRLYGHHERDVSACTARTEWCEWVEMLCTL